MQNAGHYGPGTASQVQQQPATSQQQPQQQIQYHPVPSEQSPTGSNSSTQSLRQFRKKENVEKGPEGAPVVAQAQQQKLEARVAPHSHYPQPPASHPQTPDYRYSSPMHHQYQEYSPNSLGPGGHHQPKYDLSENHHSQNSPISTSVIQKPKNMEICQQSPGHIKQSYPHQIAPSGHIQNYGLENNQLLQSPTQIHPSAYKPTEAQYYQKEQYHHQIPGHHPQKYHQMMPPQNLRKYANPGEENFLSKQETFLGKLTKLNPSMARSIMSEHHLQETLAAGGQPPNYPGMEQRGMYQSNQRYYPGSMHHPSQMGYPSNNYPPMSYANYAPSCNYSRAPNMSAGPPARYNPQLERDISPSRRPYSENLHHMAMCATMSQKLPTYPHQYNPSPEYSQHYRHRRDAMGGVVPQEYYQTTSGYGRPPQYMGGHQMPPGQSLQEVSDSGPVTLSSDNLKKFVENWMDEDELTGENTNNGTLIGEQIIQVSMVNPSDVPLLENRGIPVVTPENGHLQLTPEGIQYLIKTGIFEASNKESIVSENGSQEKVVRLHIRDPPSKGDCMLGNPIQTDNPESRKVVVQPNKGISSSSNIVSNTLNAEFVDRIPNISQNLENIGVCQPNNATVSDNAKELVDKNCSPISLNEYNEGLNNKDIQEARDSCIKSVESQPQVSNDSEGSRSPTGSYKSMPIIDAFDSELNAAKTKENTSNKISSESSYPDLDQEAQKLVDSICSEAENSKEVDNNSGDCLHVTETSLDSKPQTRTENVLDLNTLSSNGKSTFAQNTEPNICETNQPDENNSLEKTSVDLDLEKEKSLESSSISEETFSQAESELSRCTTPKSSTVNTPSCSPLIQEKSNFSRDSDESSVHHVPINFKRKRILSIEDIIYPKSTKENEKLSLFHKTMVFINREKEFSSVEQDDIHKTKYNVFKLTEEKSEFYEDLIRKVSPSDKSMRVRPAQRKRRAYSEPVSKDAADLNSQNADVSPTKKFATVAVNTDFKLANDEKEINSLVGDATSNDASSIVEVSYNNVSLENIKSYSELHEKCKTSQAGAILDAAEQGIQQKPIQNNLDVLFNERLLCLDENPFLLRLQESNVQIKISKVDGKIIITTENTTDKQELDINDNYNTACDSTQDNTDLLCNIHDTCISENDQASSVADTKSKDGYLCENEMVITKEGELDSSSEIFSNRIDTPAHQNNLEELPIEIQSNKEEDIVKSENPKHFLLAEHPFPNLQANSDSNLTSGLPENMQVEECEDIKLKHILNDQEEDRNIINKLKLVTADSNEVLKNEENEKEIRQTICEDAKTLCQPKSLFVTAQKIDDSTICNDEPVNAEKGQIESQSEYTEADSSEDSESESDQDECCDLTVVDEAGTDEENLTDAELIEADENISTEKPTSVKETKPNIDDPLIAVSNKSDSFQEYNQNVIMQCETEEYVRDKSELTSANTTVHETNSTDFQKSSKNTKAKDTRSDIIKNDVEVELSEDNTKFESLDVQAQENFSEKDEIPAEENILISDQDEYPKIVETVESENTNYDCVTNKNQNDNHNNSLSKSLFTTNNFEEGTEVLSETKLSSNNLNNKCTQIALSDETQIKNGNSQAVKEQEETAKVMRCLAKISGVANFKASENRENGVEVDKDNQSARNLKTQQHLRTANNDLNKNNDDNGQNEGDRQMDILHSIGTNHTKCMKTKSVCEDIAGNTNNDILEKFDDVNVQNQEAIYSQFYPLKGNKSIEHINEKERTSDTETNECKDTTFIPNKNKESFEPKLQKSHLSKECLQSLENKDTVRYLSIEQNPVETNMPAQDTYNLNGDTLTFVSASNIKLSEDEGSLQPIQREQELNEEQCSIETHSGVNFKKDICISTESELSYSTKVLKAERASDLKATTQVNDDTKVTNKKSNEISEYSDKDNQQKHEAEANLCKDEPLLTKILTKEASTEIIKHTDPLSLLSTNIDHILPENKMVSLHNLSDLNLNKSLENTVELSFQNQNDHQVIESSSYQSLDKDKSLALNIINIDTIADPQKCEQDKTPIMDKDVSFSSNNTNTDTILTDQKYDQLDAESIAPNLDDNSLKESILNLSENDNSSEADAPILSPQVEIEVFEETVLDTCVQNDIAYEGGLSVKIREYTTCVDSSEKDVASDAEIKDTAYVVSKEKDVAPKEEPTGQIEGDTPDVDLKETVVQENVILEVGEESEPIILHEQGCIEPGEIFTDKGIIVLEDQQFDRLDEEEVMLDYSEVSQCEDFLEESQDTCIEMSSEISELPQDVIDCPLDNQDDEILIEDPLEVGLIEEIGRISASPDHTLEIGPLENIEVRIKATEDKFIDVQTKKEVERKLSIDKIFNNEWVVKDLTETQKPPTIKVFQSGLASFTKSHDVMILSPTSTFNEDSALPVLKATAVTKRRDSNECLSSITTAPLTKAAKKQYDCDLQSTTITTTSSVREPSVSLEELSSCKRQDSLKQHVEIKEVQVYLERLNPKDIEMKLLNFKKKSKNYEDSIPFCSNVRRIMFDAKRTKKPQNRNNVNDNKMIKKAISKKSKSLSLLTPKDKPLETKNANCSYKSLKKPNRVTQNNKHCLQKNVVARKKSNIKSVIQDKVLQKTTEKTKSKKNKTLKNKRQRIIEEDDDDDFADFSELKKRHQEKKKKIQELKTKQSFKIKSVVDKLEEIKDNIKQDSEKKIHPKVLFEPDLKKVKAAKSKEANTKISAEPNASISAKRKTNSLSTVPVVKIELQMKNLVVAEPNTSKLSKPKAIASSPAKVVTLENQAKNLVNSVVLFKAKNILHQTQNATDTSSSIKTSRPRKIRNIRKPQPTAEDETIKEKEKNENENEKHKNNEENKELENSLKEKQESLEETKNINLLKQVEVLPVPLVPPPEISNDFKQNEKVLVPSVSEFLETDKASLKRKITLQDYKKKRKIEIVDKEAESEIKSSFISENASEKLKPVEKTLKETENLAKSSTFEKTVPTSVESNNNKIKTIQPRRKSVECKTDKINPETTITNSNVENRDSPTSEKSIRIDPRIRLRRKSEDTVTTTQPVQSYFTRPSYFTSSAVEEEANKNFKASSSKKVDHKVTPQNEATITQNVVKLDPTPKTKESSPKKLPQKQIIQISNTTSETKDRQSKKVSNECESLTKSDFVLKTKQTSPIKSPEKLFRKISNNSFDRREKFGRKSFRKRSTDTILYSPEAEVKSPEVSYEEANKILLRSSNEWEDSMSPRRQTTNDDPDALKVTFSGLLNKNSKPIIDVDELKLTIDPNYNAEPEEIGNLKQNTSIEEYKERIDTELSSISINIPRPKREYFNSTLEKEGRITEEVPKFNIEDIKQPLESNELIQKYLRDPESITEVEKEIILKIISYKRLMDENQKNSDNLSVLSGNSQRYEIRESGSDRMKLHFKRLGHNKRKLSLESPERCRVEHKRIDVDSPQTNWEDRVPKTFNQYANDNRKRIVEAQKEKKLYREENKYLRDEPSTTFDRRLVEYEDEPSSSKSWNETQSRLNDYSVQYASPTKKGKVPKIIFKRTKDRKISEESGIEVERTESNTFKGKHFFNLNEDD